MPKSDEELLHPKWKGKIGMDHSKPEWFSWKLKRMGEEKGLAYMKNLGAQEFKPYSGLTILTGLLAAGEFPLVLNTYLHNVEDAKRKSAPVDWVTQDPVLPSFNQSALAPRPLIPMRQGCTSISLLGEEGQKIIKFLRPRADTTRHTDNGCKASIS